MYTCVDLYTMMEWNKSTITISTWYGVKNGVFTKYRIKGGWFTNEPLLQWPNAAGGGGG